MISSLDNHFLPILDDLDDGVYFVDSQRVISFWNRSAERITGYRAVEVIGRSCKDNILIHVNEEGVSLCQNFCPVSKTLQDGITQSANVFLHHKHGHRVPVHVRTFPLRNENGGIFGVAEVFTDNSFQRIEANKIQELIKYSFVDETTGFFNQRYAKTKIISMLNEMHNNKVPFAVLSVNINNYQELDETHGQKIAEGILAITAKTTNSVIDLEKVICRWKNEQLIVLILNVKEILIQRYVEKLRIMLQESFISNNEEKIYPQAKIDSFIVKELDKLEDVVEQIRCLKKE